MRRILLLLLIGAFALVIHFEVSDGVTIKNNRELEYSRTVTVPIEITIIDDRDASKTQRQTSIGDEITQLFFGENTTPSIDKGSGLGMVAQLQTVSDKIDSFVGTAAGAGQGIQQDTNNFGFGGAQAGNSFTASEIGQVPQTGPGVVAQLETVGVNIDPFIGTTGGAGQGIQQDTNNFGFGGAQAGNSFTASEIGQVPQTGPGVVNIDSFVGTAAGAGQGIQQNTNNFGFGGAQTGNSFTASEIGQVSQTGPGVVNIDPFIGTTVGAGQGIQQDTNNFGFGGAEAGNSFIASDIGQVPQTETTGNIFISTTGDGFQTNTAGVQGAASPNDYVFQTTIPSTFVSFEQPGQFQIEQKPVIGVQVTPNSKESIDMISTLNFPGSAQQIPVFINSKIQHAVFNIHSPVSTSRSPVRGNIVEKPNDSSIELEISGQFSQSPIQSTGTQMPIGLSTQVAQDQDFNLGTKLESVVDFGVTGMTQIQGETSIPMNPNAGSFDTHKITIGEFNPIENTPADTFAISGIIAQTDLDGDQLLQVTQSGNIQNVISDDRSMRSALASMASQLNPVQPVVRGVQVPITNSGRIVSGDVDGDNISLEVVGFIPNNQRGIQNRTVVGNTTQLLVKIDDDGALSTEVFGRINVNQTIFTSRPFPDATLVLNRGGNQQIGNTRTVTLNQVELSREIDVNLSVENEDGRIQAPTNPLMNSDEQDDFSLEVNFNLLPQIKRLMRPLLQKKENVKRPKMVFFEHSEEETDVTLELNNILTNPVFQQNLQEMDERLKSVPAARGKRLMEKYAQALVSSAAVTINFSLYLPLFVACLLVKWLH